jgi:hypothetical protein
LAVLDANAVAIGAIAFAGLGDDQDAPWSVELVCALTGSDDPARKIIAAANTTTNIARANGFKRRIDNM